MNKPSSLSAPKRRSPSAEVTRQHITDALLMLLEQKPVWEISIADITRQVGVSSQLFYAHFKNIEAVLAAHQDVILRDNPDIAAISRRSIVAPSPTASSMPSGRCGECPAIRFAIQQVLATQDHIWR